MLPVYWKKESFVSLEGYLSICQCWGFFICSIITGVDITFYLQQCSPDKVSN